jgi:hypothetical protein
LHLWIITRVPIGQHCKCALHEVKIYTYYDVTYKQKSLIIITIVFGTKFYLDSPLKESIKIHKKYDLYVANALCA